ncbi:MAG: hypothetical protein WCF65_07260 [Parachlamydiaceae bacterium]
MNISEKSHWFFQNEILEIKDNQIVKVDINEKIVRTIFSHYDKKCIKKIADFIKEKLTGAKGSRKYQYSMLADAFIFRYRDSWNGGEIAKAFDRAIAPQREELIFHHAENDKTCKKWKQYGMPLGIYHEHPEFCSFLETSGLLSQMKVTKDRMIMLDGEPAIRIGSDDQYIKWTEIKNRFEITYSSQFSENFITEKMTGDVYTYLDNGKGLQKHHPYLTVNSPISFVNEEDYNKILTKAREFIRSDEDHLLPERREELHAKRTFVIQLVSSTVDGPNTKAHELLHNKKHPYLRLIIGEDNTDKNVKKGEVYEIGYGWKNKLLAPFVASEGQFRSPDLWEYKSCRERVVTNISVTPEEANIFTTYTLDYHRKAIIHGKSMGFHLARQNCSTYVRFALGAINISIPTEINLSELIDRISPDWFSTVSHFFSRVVQTTHEVVSWTLNKIISILPKETYNFVTSTSQKIQKTILSFIEACAAFSLIPVNIVLGGASGKGGAAFVSSKKKPEKINSSLSNKERWYKLSSYRFNLPGILQEWQHKQASTVIYNSPIKLAIVP